MRRLIYAPKAYVFIRSSNMGIVYDVSADVTSGTVTQNLGDLSKAQFTLRNRYRKWVRDPDTQQQIFLPMDMVTIWLQRIAGRPIQVFTGYLDAVPYYQALPADAQFEASCTLKKLAFSWFDPGLPFFQQWVFSQDGWQITPDGDATNPAYLTPDQAGTTNSALVASKGTTGTVNDGGFDALLGQFMTTVAGWSNNDVLISALPKDLPKMAARLYADVNKNTMNDLAVLEQALGQTMGIGGFDGSNASALQTTNGAASTPAAVQVISQIKQAASTANVPILFCAFVSYVLTGLDPNWNDDTKGYYGLYAMSATTTTTGEPTIEGTTVSDIVGDPVVATQVFCKRVASVANNMVGLQNPTLDQCITAAKSVLGRSFTGSQTDLQTAFNTVKQYCASGIVSTTPTSSPSSSVDPGSLTFKDPTVLKLCTDQEKQVIRDNYGQTKPWLAGVLWRAKQVSSNNQISRPLAKLSNVEIALTGTPSSLANFYSSLVNDPTIDKIDAIIDGHHYLLQHGVVSSLPATTKNNNTMVVTQSTQPTQNTPTNSNSGSQTTQGGGATLNDLTTLSANAAFAAQFAFPANVIQSISLTGNRALMNDVSCLDGVKQFAQASMRTFRSLPDGRFCAFYPDYFGATRKAYWQIYNIEIIDFGIQLNDEALATHVYVVGDTFDGDGQITWQDQVSTRGVATITQAFMLNSFIDTYSKVDPKAPLQQPLLGRLADAYSFLQQYGARPYEEDQPLIRNVFYEFLLAWQRFMQKWSSQFATNCTFTFQPEVMAGGLISFPDHGIQMFCESVTHTWDYTNGFQTTAVMTAPSLLPGKQKDDTAKPGFALAGNVNTVGT